MYTTARPSKRASYRKSMSDPFNGLSPTQALKKQLSADSFESMDSGDLDEKQVWADADQVPATLTVTRKDPGSRKRSKVSK